MTDPDSLQSAIRATVDKFGRLDVLHNNAGGSTARDDTAVNAPLDEFWRAIRLDLYGTFLGCRFGIPELIKAGGGSVINMSSNVALTRLADSHLLGLIEPDDIASTALYLASDESRMVTGQVLPVDSGVTIS